MSERLTWSEAEAVVRAFRAEHGMSADVDVETLARTLGTSPAEIKRLAGTKRRFTDRSGVVSALVTCAVVLLAILILGPSRLSKSPLAQRSSRPHPVTRTTVIVADGTGKVHLFDAQGNPAPTDLWMYRTWTDDPTLVGVHNEKIL